MRAVWGTINIVLAFALLVASTVVADAADAPAKGRKSKKPKLLKHVRVHVESRHDLAERSLAVEVGKPPMRFQVEKLPILNEVHVERATLIEEDGAYQVRLQFNSIGARILESYSSSAAGRHFGILVDIDGDARWVAAPVIRRRIGDGVLTFTPTATRDEMDRLVRGLNAEVEKNRKRWLN